MGLILYDSTFFVDLDREGRKRVEGPAHQFLERYGSEEMAMSVITKGELARGFDSREGWEAFCRGYVVLPVDDAVLWIAAEQFRKMKGAGTPISDNHLWIGSTALAHDLPLVSNNTSHFRKMKGLRLLDHR